MSADEQEELASAHQRQVAIDAVVAKHSGEPLDVVQARLVEELRRQGLSRPPDQWLDAVATEIRAKHIYVTSPDAARHDDLVQEHRPDQS